MKISPLGFGLILAVAGVALWLLIGGTGRVFGIDVGTFGVALLVTLAWTSLYAVSALPGGDFERQVSPGEWRAWIGVGFMVIALVYFLAKLPLFQGEAFGHAHHASAVGRNLVLLLIAWAVLESLLSQRWKDRVQADERDRQIQVRADRSGHTALIVALVSLAVTLGFSPADRLAWASHFMIANLIVAALMVGWLVEYLTMAWQYWQDRR